MVRVIKPKQKMKTEKFKVQISMDVVEQLKLYQDFISEEDVDYIIEEAIKQIFEAKEFKEWKKGRGKSGTKESEKINEQVI